MISATILLDVDGALNPFGRFNPNGAMPGYEKHTILDLPIWLNPSIGEALVEVAAAHDAQLMWCTTWGARADHLIAPHAGLPSGLPVLDLPDIDAVEIPLGRPSTWKLASVMSWCETMPRRHRVAWIDDDLWRDARDWAKERGSTLLIQTAASKGITRRDLERLGTWLASTETGPS